VLNIEEELTTIERLVQALPLPQMTVGQSFNVIYPVVLRITQLREAVKAQLAQSLTPQQMYQNHPIVRAEREANGGMDTQRHDRHDDARPDASPGDH
jgi:hypothetical protein